MADKRRLDDPQLWRLLWRGEEQPSARSGLTVGRIVRAGIELADEAGLEALSMRRVAERLGVGAMSLYTYVPGKQELVVLMVEEVHGELPTDPPAAAGATGGATDVLVGDAPADGDALAGDAPADGDALAGGDRGESQPGWRAGLRRMAEEYWDLYQRHEWLLDVPLTRPATGPNLMDRYERDIALVDGIGLDEFEMTATIELIYEHVAGAARRLRAIRRDAEASGLSDEEWWYRLLPTLNQLLADRNYPVTSRVGEALSAPHLDTGYLFHFGLERILDGIEAHIARRRAG